MHSLYWQRTVSIPYTVESSVQTGENNTEKELLLPCRNEPPFACKLLLFLKEEGMKREPGSPFSQAATTASTPRTLRWISGRQTHILLEMSRGEKTIVSVCPTSNHQYRTSAAVLPSEESGKECCLHSKMLMRAERTSSLNLCICRRRARKRQREGAG